MSAREPLSHDEQALAGRLREWSIGGPSAALDAGILAQSRAAVAPKRGARRPWLVSVASAAALVLTVGVVWRTIEAPRNDAIIEPPRAPASDAPLMPRDQQPPDSGVGPATPAGQPESVFRAERAGPPDAELHRSAAAVDATAAQSTTEQRESSAARSIATPTTPSAPPVSARQRAVAPAAAPPPAPPPPPAPAFSPAPAAPSPMPAAPSASSSEKASVTRDTRGEPAPIPAEPPPAETDTPRDSERDGTSGVDANGGSRSADVRTLEQSEPREDREGGFAEDIDDRGLGAMAAPEEFAKGIAAIRALVRQKRIDEAVRAIADLRRQHPRKQLPADLLAIERDADRQR